jgi:hypothetical protein
MYTRQCFIFFVLTLFMSLFLYAQGTLESDTRLAVSSNPTVMELTRLFSETTAGQHDPFQVLPKVVSLGNRVVPTLRGFLFETPALKVAVLDSNGSVIDSVNAPVPNRVYGVMALDLIGTPAAYSVLADVVNSDTSREVRGAALRAFALSYYYRVEQDSLTPDKEVVHLLMRNMEDTAYVEGCSMEIGEIARQGLKNWTGTDYGEILPDSLRVKDENRLGMSLPQHREQRWQKESGKMKWNKDTGHFELKQN